MAFFQHINYAASHEDGRSELRALAIDPSSRVLCITGSGSRALDLLLARPRELVAIDFNPAQTQLLALKIAAMRALSYDAYVAFLGLVASSERLSTYAQLRPLLGQAARAFWDRQRGALARGVLYSGRWERFLRAMVAPAAYARRALIARVFACRCLDEQRSLWLREWNTPGWDRYLGLLANRFLWTRIVREPGMRHIPSDLDIVACIRQRFDRAAATSLFRDSPWAWLVFHGRLNPEGPLPPHLQRAHFALLAAQSTVIRLVSASLLAYLAGPEAGSFSAFSLSDFGSYADDLGYAATHRAVDKAARPGARLCERQFLVPRDPTRISGLTLRRDPALERELTRHDNSVVYDFVAGSVGAATPITA